ncbi:tRNA (N(6)-L-threonylcarbamoyladenosine(37)-C(2))-methylthiotransferase MtaB [Desulforhopalus singaporensis]|uniref:Threonylcarbamoyladenosine tRNA methylthiotransferase MtaB n=1 Tax=Desulforhopalus singaporensis TaxID=91360 RepID=A0A1H0UB92_9BACT|nr:tRNA (N(6)-L-threonylcarbamoyladenosine(37)-C(2))-methylthiotransferase MtaB [Desulforhopalus singaporensis]SDP63320.1 threonylcarbamoyladenosine tRNA methylthiotransferase MtaB [Desulforhopalus singaporensis]
MKKVLITTLGCKVNQFESASFQTGFEERGFTVVRSGSDADLVVINTCAVTASAGAQSRQSIRQALRKNPDADIIITGCYAEIGARELENEKELLGRRYTIIGNSEKDRLVNSAFTRSNIEPPAPGAILQAKDICRLPVRRFGDRSRAYLRVQDGCDSFCTYCIVPFTRGPSRSLPLAEVIEQAKIFHEQGHKEIVLTGIHLGYYGHDLEPKQDITSLLDLLTRATPEVYYRISSLEPIEISRQLLQLMAERSNIQPHLHIPLQSGDDSILKKMNRRYTTDQFGDIINLCGEYLPDMAIGIDILAGFPGETEEHFNNGVRFLQSLDFTYLHVFPYSIRPGTEAARMKGQISQKEKEVRVAQLRLLSDRKKKLFYQNQLGTIRTVLVEGKKDRQGMLKGITDNYVAVRFKGPDSLLNTLTKVRLDTLQNDHVSATQV